MAIFVRSGSRRFQPSFEARNVSRPEASMTASALKVREPAARLDRPHPDRASAVRQQLANGRSLVHVGAPGARVVEQHPVEVAAPPPARWSSRDA